MSEEVEIFNADEGTEFEEAECEAEAEATAGPLKWHEIQQEISNMKKRIEYLRKLLKLEEIDECPLEKCEDFDILVHCSRNDEISMLQRNQGRLRKQILRLINMAKGTKSYIKRLRSRICEQDKEISMMRREIDALKSWRAELDHMFNLCEERFEYLKHVKMEWTDVVRIVEEHKQSLYEIKRQFYPRKCFNVERNFIVKEIKELNELFRELYELQIERFNELERRHPPMQSSQYLHSVGSNLNLKRQYHLKERNQSDISYND